MKSPSLDRRSRPFLQIPSQPYSPGSAVLHRPGDPYVQSLGRPPRPVRVAQELTSKKNEVRLLGGENRIGLSGIGNHAHSSSRNPSWLANRLRKSNLIAGSNRNLCIRHTATTRRVDQIDTHWFQPL